MRGAQDITRINRSKHAIASDRREREDIQLQVSPHSGPDIYTSELIETEPPGLVVLYVISSISYICVINAKYMGREEWVINIIIHCGCK